MRPTVQFLDLLASPQTRLHERVDEMCKGGEGIYKNGEVSEETKDVADDKRRAGHPRQTVFMAVHRQSFETQNKINASKKTTTSLRELQRKL